MYGVKRLRDLQYFKAEILKHRVGRHGEINQTKMELNFADWWGGGGVTRQIAYEVINLIQVNSSCKKHNFSYISIQFLHN